MMDTESFYADLPILNHLLELTNSKNFKSLPSDWYLIITDIVGSTQAIESGYYKDVNLIGASSIIAVLNIAGQIEIPFGFGGGWCCYINSTLSILKSYAGAVSNTSTCKNRIWS